jgi:hypothetical protein
MSLWSNTDANTSAPKFVGVGGSPATGLELYANTTTGAFIADQKVGVFGVDTTEIGLDSNKAKKPAHSGWVLVKEGTGGRAGRVQTEVLVAMGSMLASGETTAAANDDVTFADA